MQAIPLQLVVTLLVLVSVVCANGQQVTFSVDVQGPTAGALVNPPILDSFYGEPIDGGDILTVGVPDQPLPPEANVAQRGPISEPPGIVVFGGNPGLPNARNLGLAESPIGSREDLELEIDALSFGHDIGLGFLFSVDEFSFGGVSHVAEQSLLGEASADVFRAIGGPEGNVLAIDGEGGEFPNRALGFGLIEPNPPEPTPDIGDNLDAFDMNTFPEQLAGPIYFSLGTGIPDPFEQPNAIINSANQNNVRHIIDEAIS